MLTSRVSFVEALVDNNVDVVLARPEYTRCLVEIMSGWAEEDFTDFTLPVLMHFVEATILAHADREIRSWIAVDRAASLATQAQIVWENSKVQECCNFKTGSTAAENSPLMMLRNLDLRGVEGRGAEKALRRVVEVMLQRDDIDLWTGTESRGYGWLHWACQEGHEAVVKLLLEKDGSKEHINAEMKDGVRPLHFACQKGHEAVVKLLLEKDGSKEHINAEMKDGVRPLHFACQKGHKAVVELLLEKDGSKEHINAKTKYGMTPLHFACLKGHEAVVKLLLADENIEVNVEMWAGTTPLHQACKGGHEAVVKLLLADKNIDANPKEESGRTPLYIACEKGDEAVVKQLLNKQNMDVDAKDKRHWPLHNELGIAQMNGHEAVEKLLLDNYTIDVPPLLVPLVRFLSQFGVVELRKSRG